MIKQLTYSFLFVFFITHSANVLAVSRDDSTPSVSRNHLLIHADKAHQRGYTGKGVTITIVDSGVDPNHPMFKNRLLPGWDTRTSSKPNRFDDNGHGTHVAGIAAGGIVEYEEAYKGIAYDALILPIVLNFEGSSDATTAKMITYSLDAESIVSNNSWGYVDYIYDTNNPDNIIGIYSIPISEFDRNDFLATRPLEVAAYIHAVNQDHIFVFAAGNHFNGDEYKDQPGMMAALPIFFPELEGHWVSVVNVDMDGRIADSSHYCGDTAAWCIAAPGTDIRSAEADGTFVEYTGTSMAAPHVTGSIAVVAGAFPNLTHDKVLNRIFVTANKQGIYSDRAIYGQGLLDLDKATLPIGQLMMLTGSDATHHRQPLMTQWFKNSALFSPALDKMKAVSIATVDSYDNARFLVPFGTLATTEQVQSSAAQTLTTQAQTRQIEGKNAFSQWWLQYQPNQLNPHSRTRFSWQQKTIDGSQWTFGFRQPNQWSSSAQTVLVNTLWEHPYLQFAAEGYQMSYQGPFEYSPKWSVSLGSSSRIIHAPNATNDNYGLLYAQPIWRSDQTSWQAISGMIIEKNGILGADGSQMFGAYTNTPTYYIGLEGNLRFNSQWEAIVGLYQGKTKSATLPQSSIFQTRTPIDTESAQLGLIHTMVSTGGQMGFLIRQPLHVTKGKALLHLPVEVDTNQQVQYHDYELSLDSKRALEYTWFYQTPIRYDLDLTAMVQYQAQSTDIPGLLPKSSGMLSVSKRF